MNNDALTAKRLDSHEKRIRVLERIVWIEMGAAFMIEALPVMHAFVTMLGK